MLYQPLLLRLSAPSAGSRYRVCVQDAVRTAFPSLCRGISAFAARDFSHICRRYGTFTDRPFQFPDTWKGRRANQRALAYWQGMVKKLGGKDGEKDIERRKRSGRPIDLVVDPTSTKTMFHPLGIRFHRKDKFAHDLVESAHPVRWSQRPRWIRWLIYVVATYYVLITISCLRRERVPITRRGRISTKIFMVTPDHRRAEPESNALRRRLLPEDSPQVQQARSVFARIVSASGLAHLDWDLQIVDAPDEANATAAAQGEVVLYSGMFEAAESEDEIAVVLGHEVAHVLAGHQAEKIRVWVTGFFAGLPFLPIVLLGQIFEAAYLIGLPPLLITTLITLALSRSRESEADYIGQLLMADAGYDPLACATMFAKVNEIEERQIAEMKKKHKNFGPQSTYMSTHPHTPARIKQNADWAPISLQIVGRSGPSTTQDWRVTKEVKSKQQGRNAFVESRKEESPVQS